MGRAAASSPGHLGEQPASGSGESPRLSASDVATPTASAEGTQKRYLVGPARGAPLKIGVIVPSGDAGAALGLEVTGTPPATAENEIRALARQINQRGGFGGRPITLVFQRQDRTDESEGTATRIQNAICAAFSEDERVDFVIALADASTTYANDCYVRHQTPVLTESSGSEDSWFKRAPWLMPTLDINISRTARLLPVGLAEQGFLTQRMGVIAFDRSPEKEITTRYLVPGIERAGGKVLSIVYSAVSYQDLASQSSGAVLRFKSLGVDRVVFMAPGGGAWLVFAQAAQSQDYHPRYGLSGLDSPNFTADLVPRDQLQGARGVGTVPAVDVAADQRPPLKPGVRECWKYLNSTTGSAYVGDDTSGLLAALRCEKMYVAEAGFAHTYGTEYQRSQVQGSFLRIGTAYESLIFPQLTFRPGHADGANVFAHVMWDEAGCGCFRYASAFRPIPV